MDTNPRQCDDSSTTSNGGRAEPLPTLGYARRVTLLERVRSIASREVTGISMIVGGFLFARRFGNSHNLWGDAGVALIVLGVAWYIVSRLGRRTWMSRLVRTQLFLAAMLCIGGVLAVFSIASNSREGRGPETLFYWLNSNQNYRWDSRVALRRGWITVVGIVWFVAVLMIDRVWHWRRTRSACRPLRGSE